MPGATGTFEFKPTDWIEGATTWRKDTAGIGPGEPSCHIGTDETGEPDGRMFGEACLPDGMLVETNPEEAAHETLGVERFSPYVGRSFQTRPLWGDQHLHAEMSVNGVALCRLGQERAQTSPIWCTP